MPRSLLQTHIDIGSGNSWIVQKMTSMYKNVIGIKLSIARITIAIEAGKTINNIRFTNKDIYYCGKHLKFTSFLCV